MAASSFSKRVVALVDMDCFYVQVVQRKDPSLKGKPCAVVQYNSWRGGGIIAVGYEARNFGVTRQMRGDEAKQKCPDIHLVSVPESRGKADLTLFREAGAEVIDVLAEFTDCLERASIDEAYMDLTNAINREMSNYDIEEVALDTFKNTHLVNLDNKNSISEESTDEVIKKCDLFKAWITQLRGSEECFQLAIGAVIANKMRTAVKEKTGFSCSAGVGPNKMLAKIVAGFHKPNQQTLVLTENVPEMFETTKMRKIRSLGGKLGAQLEGKFHVEFMAQLVPISLQELQSTVGTKNGNIVYWLCRGVDNEPVRPRQFPQSVGCSKNFRGKMTLRSKQDVHKWLTNLCEEVVERLDKEKLQNGRVPTLLTVGCTNEDQVSQSRRYSVVKHTVEGIRDEAFKALCEFNNASSSGNDWSPAIINLHLSAGKFVSTGGSMSINSFMSKLPDGCKQQDIETSFHDAFQIFHTKSSNTQSSKPAGISKYFSHQTSRSKEGVKTIQNNSSEVMSSSGKRLSKDLSGLLSKTVTRKPLASNPCSNTIKDMKNIDEEDEDPLVSIASTVPTNRLTLENVDVNCGKDEHSQHKISYHKNKQEESGIFTSTRPSSISSSKNPDNQSIIDSEKAETRSTSDMGNRLSTNLEKEKTHATINSKDSVNRSTIDSLLSKQKQIPTNTAATKQSPSINDLVICDRCGKRLLAWDLPDHMDFHFAKDLQDSLRGNFFSMCGTGSENRGQTNKRKTSSQDSKANKKLKTSNTLSKYFSPTKKPHKEL